MSGVAVQTGAISTLADAGVATVYEARGRKGLVDVDLIQLVAGSRAAGPARTVLCAQDDNRGVHELCARIQPGEIAVLTMPEARPVALIGDLLVTQLQVAGAAGILCDASVRDVEELRGMGIPVWTRWIRAHGAGKDARGQVDAAVEIGGATVRTGDIVVLDADGAAVVPADEIDIAVELVRAREQKEEGLRSRWRAGELSYDAYGFRAEDEEKA
ncbi:dimethylmenaquinone methyltransferase [Agrococcus jenensis]|uniref:Putative 4-hydroxy-4-methyl-2-oxoglutarate aldolase n=1 Tax=Agrococcus jenensis TaxID=46353 RepID=A0A3N2ARZ3_9MICO|nr:dimethylmenaquinone methyltransferase [Agrococcus jenensis]ROR65756.1 4-carboxy-4-hydroxy-2-oxoadipate aldolase [Agrococcus jenensis]